MLSSLELRELEVKLKTAYVNKERVAQIAEQEAMRLETMVSPLIFNKPPTRSPILFFCDQMF